MFCMNTLNKTILRMDRWISGQTIRRIGRCISGWMVGRIDSLINDHVVSVFGMWVDMGVARWVKSRRAIDRLGPNVRGEIRRNTQRVK